ncbi:DNA-3-methyladenine glycosylase [endosymbiont GvMRE of Glomus versiforme]|uniref:DNA-3-methyladenine glycosylase n=1 Tax=endosymbiont GvMRE of Glomus versiforme TaxID=2039283 RepID=UPI000EE1480C|nr:DNA-3-methyladenine glycosylase [endosymbiont GvMRE of Glomus versiforme]RHZ37109.1 DNA-3-methyladenine glycosylase [endosymbiont GvMRE of Glomus versiforme]
MDKENKIIMRITDLKFFTVDAVELAQKLLGKILVRNINGKIIKVRIVETEAYNGKIDRACHAHKENKPTRSINSCCWTSGKSYYSS